MSTLKKYGFRGTMKKLILIISILLSILFSGCNVTTLIKNGTNDLKEKISSEIAESK